LSSFEADEVGKEQILALITQELPPFDWLDKSAWVCQGETNELK